ncbi:MAG: GNAT family N-acetyltransferase [Lachnospiraceae bacterium]|jgi:serine/alanine adding enzyme|nr:GNAT family N-acetyltransferase [Lachnospiraceae bacterium]
MDIYFEPDYGKLYEKIEHGEADSFRFEDADGLVTHHFIRREIPVSVQGGPYYDLITPYGYGGPAVQEAKDGKRAQLCRDFGEAFASYCREQRIVSEFVRFHPVAGNAADFKDLYSAVCIRQTLGTNLAAYDDPVQSEFSKGCRKNIRQALRHGVTYRVTGAPDDISGFKEIYYSTMDRDHATAFYYFGDDYFAALHRRFRDELLYVEALYGEKTIAAGLYFVSDGVIHIHLSGTRSEYLYLSPAYVLRYAATLWGKEHGCRMIHHGGGTSNSPEDSLYLFKKQFAKNTSFDFYVGRKIWDPEMYAEICRLTGADPASEFFPAYRSKQ